MPTRENMGGTFTSTEEDIMSESKSTRGRDPLTPEARLICSKDIPVVEIHGRWFITIGRPGFNSHMNNGRGWAYKSTALIALEMFTDGRVGKGGSK
jgi:hypothetical protein